MSGVGVLLDLDGTMVYSRRGVAATSSSSIASGLEVVEEIDHEPSGFIDARLGPRLAALERFARVIPITTRSIVQFRRLRLPLRGDRAVALVANGAILLRGDEVDAGWQRCVLASLRGLEIPPAAVSELVRNRVDWSRARLVDEALWCLPTSHPEAAEAAASALLLTLEGTGWQAYHVERKVYVVPDILDKGAAAVRLARLLGIGVDFAAGDSDLDVGLLRAAGHAFAPGHAPGMERLSGIAGLEVTEASGPGAAVEIIDRILARIRPDVTHDEHRWASVPAEQDGVG